jgi:DNA-binding IclR family transcriptional regulator
MTLASSPPSLAACPAERENVQAVTRALQILDAFLPDEQGVTLADLSRRVAMGKTTVLRTARTLARAGYLAQWEDGRWRLGPASGWLGVRYQTAFDVRDVIDSVLRHLTGLTGETTALFVREGNSRTCVARVERPSLARHYIRVGEKLALDHGASGQVLLAYSGQIGELYDDIRRHGFHISVGERDSKLCSVSVPVFGARRRLFGALCVSGESQRLGQSELHAHLGALIANSEKLSRALAANAARA